MAKVLPTWLLAGLVLASGVVSAERSQAPTFRSGTALLTVDVAVFDRDGRPVPGLGPESFEVKLDGRVQPVRVVSYLEARGEQAAADPPGPERPPPDGRPGRQMISNAGVVDPRAPAGEDRVFVILVDDLSIPPTRGQRLLAAARQFVAAIPATDPIGVIASSDPSKPVGPTLDRDVIAEALSRVSGSSIDLLSLQVQGQPTAEDPSGPIGISQAIRIDQGGAADLKDAIALACFGGDYSVVDAQVLDVVIATNQCAGRVQRNARMVAAQAKQIRANQVGAMAGVISAMGAASGIRHLVIISDGIAVGRDVDALRPIAEAAARAGVQVSVLMDEHDLSLADEGRTPNVASAGGENVSLRRVDSGAPQRRLEDQRMLMDGLQTAAGLAGGQFYRVVGDPAPFFERVRTASAAVYRLGIELPPGLPPGRALTVDARVTRAGVSTFVNRHAFVPEPAPAAPPKPVRVEDRLTEIIASGRQYGAVPLQVATLLRRAPGASGHTELTISLALPPMPAGPVRGPVLAMFGLAPAGAGAGAPLTSGRRVIESPGAGGLFEATFGVPIAAGEYRLRVAVADAEGAFGAIETMVDAALPELGPFTASDLLLAWVDEAGQPQMMALDPLPSRATGVRAELELYPPATGVAFEAVQIEFSLTRRGETDSLDERIVTPRDAGGVWRAATEFAADDLEPGRYTLRARVHVGDRVVGSAIATFAR